jgi:hypothetical protein
MKLFKSLADQRADLAAKLAEASSQASAHSAAAVEAALGNGDISKAEAAARTAEQRAATYAAAITSLDARIADEQAKAAAAALKAKRDAALALATERLESVKKLRVKALSILEAMRLALVLHDGALAGVANQLLVGRMGQSNYLAWSLDASRVSYEAAITLQGRGDENADELANRILSFQAPELEPLV